MKKAESKDFSTCFETALKEGANPLVAFAMAEEKCPGAPIAISPGAPDDRAFDRLRRFREFPQLRRT